VDAESPLRAGTRTLTTGSASLKEFTSGQRVKVRKPNNQPGYNDGTILRKNVDGTYRVEYNSGQIENDVKALRITVPKEAPIIDESKSSDPFFVGEKVEAPFRGSAKTFPGTVIVDNKDGTYAIKFADGDEDSRVPEEKIRRVENNNDSSKSAAPSSSTSSAVIVYRMGEKVEARYNGGMTWLPGQILFADHDGSYDIRYENGREENKVPGRFIRPRGNITSRTTGSDFDVPVFSINSRVEARHRGGSKWFLGRVTFVGNDGTYSIRYEDGEVEDRVLPKFIRNIPGTGPSLRSSEGGRRYYIYLCTVSSDSFSCTKNITIFANTVSMMD
jgi:hypothetical protein